VLCSGWVLLKLLYFSQLSNGGAVRIAKSYSCTREKIGY